MKLKRKHAFTMLLIPYAFLGIFLVDSYLLEGATEMFFWILFLLSFLPCSALAAYGFIKLPKGETTITQVLTDTIITVLLLFGLIGGLIGLGFYIILVF